MIRGIYTAATGMLAQQFVQDNIASNLANVNTVGFKQDIPSFTALHTLALSRYEGTRPSQGVPIGQMGVGTVFERTVTDFSEGSLVLTRNPLDVALQGSGYFAIQTPQGERYTRAGQFHRVPNGRGPDGKALSVLADDTGNAVLGQRGPINIGDAQEVTITDDGRVLADKVLVDRLKLVNAPSDSLQKEGANYFRLTSGTATPATPRTRQGYLEQSNVSAVGTMVQMLSIQRVYESLQHAIQAQDDSLGKAVNEAPRT